MNLEAVKEVIYDLVSGFFGEATVLWSEQINTKPPLPYVTLKVSGINKTRFPVLSEDDIRYYPSSTTLEINIYTKGQAITTSNHVTGNHSNTAMSDLNDFFNYVDSEMMVDWLANKGIDISLIPPIRDLTDLQNDSKYRYRSMAEATVSFAEEADGPYGISGMYATPNSSGGGKTEMKDTVSDVIEEIEIKEGGID